MNIIIYESSSFGGCYKYALELFKAYKIHAEVGHCEILLPRNAHHGEAKKCLVNDRPRHSKKFHFLFRQIWSPLRLFIHVLFKKRSLVILNDFEQITSFIWVPLFRIFARQHVYAVVLHDPDRDAYPPSKRISELSMKQMMKLMHLGFYHEHLPDKPYYQLYKKTRYISVPHGIYPSVKPDQSLLTYLLSFKDSNNPLTPCNEHETLNTKHETRSLLSILGHIRREKNYEDAIRTLVNHPDRILLIAGAASHSGVNPEEYKKSARDLGVEHQVIWVEKYLNDAEFAACAQASDIILLNYSSSFTSQSGILNVVAPFQKPLVVSRIKSSLTEVTERYKLGELCLPDNAMDLERAVRNILTNQEFQADWEGYYTYASWERHVAIVLEEARKVSS